MRIGSLCSGAAGLDLAVEEVFGAETAWHCEIDDAASKVLAHRYPGVPNHRDLITTDWETVEPVDIVCGGWPCQPWSSAGKRLGEADERAIWPHIAGAIRILRPRIVVLENVPTVARVGELERVANSLAGIGYDLRWTCLRASDVGAPHQRKRIFIVASNPAFPEWGVPRQHGVGTAFGSAAELGECAGSSSSGEESDALLPTPNASDCTGGGAHPDRRRGHSRQLIDFALLAGTERWGQYAAAISRWEALTRPAPAPTEPNKNGNPRLSAAFSEWLMGWPEGWITDPAIGLSRNDQLRICGNGVVPAQAAAALRWLLSVSEVAA